MKPDSPPRAPAGRGSLDSDSLLIVARTKPGLYPYARRLLTRYPTVQVVLDRRGGERRVRVSPIEADRRRTERRSGAGPGAELRGRGWTMVRRRQRRPDSPTEG